MNHQFKWIVILLGLLVLVSTASAVVTQYNSTLGSDTIIIFNGTGSIDWTPPINTTIWYLVVAGGGGGGTTNIAGSAGGGGGGAGGLLNSTFIASNATNYTITVGTGGVGSVLNFNGSRGGNSSIANSSFNITSVGGGGGASYPNGTFAGGDKGGTGGSGGGNCYNDSAAGGINISGQGFYGGTATTSSQYGGGGGGGAGAAGGSGTGAAGGAGGIGLQVNITGCITYYAGGGGGSINGFGSTLGAGGAGGGVSGARSTPSAAPSGLGGGGGGGAQAAVNGGAGGSGVIIVRYSNPSPPNANFTMSNTTGFNSVKVNFTDTSLYTPTSWNWTFGGANFSDGQNPNYTFVGAGNYTVILNASNSVGWNNTTRYVTVFALGNYGNNTTFFINSSINLTGYQVKLILNNTTGVSGANAGIFYTNGTTRPNWEDVIFTDSSDNLLGFWKENNTEVTNNATFWIRVPTIWSLNNTTVKMYYGCTTTSSFASGYNTFQFFDDFIDTELSLNWTNLSGGQATISNGVINITANSATARQILSNYSRFSWTQPYAVRARVMSGHKDTSHQEILTGFANSSNSYGQFAYYSLASASYVEKYNNYNGGYNVIAISGWSAGAYHIQDMMRNGTTSSRFRVDNANDVEYSTGYQYTVGHVGAYVDTSGSIIVSDWLFVRNYTQFEPIIINANASNIPFSNDTWFPSGNCYYMINQSTNDTIVKCNATGTYNWTIPANTNGVWYLVIAGGGAGGGQNSAGNSGGGGAGGLLNGTLTAPSAGIIYNITVGTGGINSTASATRGGNGTNSSFGNLTYNLTAVGGGGGGIYVSPANPATNGSNGGSGGGSGQGAGSPLTGGSNVSGQGWAGNSSGTSYYAGSGGGGAGEVGWRGTGGANLVSGGKGGNGSLNSITGCLTYYAGGGSGSSWTSTGTNDGGGLGGGGRGKYGSNLSTSGLNEYGGGGGGGGENTFYGANGGSGVVYLRYNTTQIPPVANFIMSNTTGWNSVNVNFTDTSSGVPTSWNWTFGGANFSDGQNPNYTFVGAGNYTVILNVSNSVGWNNTTKYVTVFGPGSYGNNTTFFVNSSVNLTNYQVKLILNNTTGISNITGIFYTNGTTRTDWNDIVFTDSSNNLLGFWKENNTDVATNATFWIKVPAIWSLNNTTIRMYYGCSTQIATYADGYNTFLFFDDFLGTSLNSTQWRSIGTVSVANGYVQHTTTAATTVQGIFSMSQYGIGTAVRIRLNDSAASFPEWGYDNGGNEMIGFTDDGAFKLYTYINPNQANVYVTTATTSFHVDDVMRPNTTLGRGCINGICNSTTNYISANAINVSLRNYASSGSRIMFSDWFVVRTYNASEPIIINANGTPLVPPVANFTMSNRTGSHPLKVNFTDTSTNTPAAWNWSFGDGTYSDFQYPNKTFTTFGNYTVILNASNADGWNNKTQYVLVSNLSDYTIVTYTSNSTLTIPANVTFIEYVVVAGGGSGGGYFGGGGGAGGLLQGNGYSVLSNTNYSIIIGAGGAAGAAGGTNGTNSSFGNGTNITAIGGGEGAVGGAQSGSGRASSIGGSGGGGGSTVAVVTGSSGISGQGNSGGDSGGQSGQHASGGGGGSSESGATAANGGPGGKGGNGTQVNITGTLTWYAGGGGGASGSGSTAGAGGNGGGGSGATQSLATGNIVTDGTNATANTGGGGGGGGLTGSNDYQRMGGSGVVIIRYLVDAPAPVANFTMSNTTGWNSVKVNFTDTSTNTPTSWNWTFGGANFSDGQNPNYTFVGAGNYTVRLNVSNGGGWNNTTRYVTVFGPGSYGNNTTFFVNSTQNLTDYQVKLILNNTTGVSNISSIFYTNGTTRVDWADIVFTDTSNNLLGFWKENNTNVNTNATFWIKVPYIYSTNNTTIKMYYGCSTTLSFADGYNTFQFFDDFLGSSLDSNWTNTINTSVSGGILTVNNVGNVNSTSSFATNMSVRGRVNFVSGSNTQLFGFFRQSPLNIGTAWDFDSGSIKPANFNGGTTFGSAATSQGTYYIYEVTKNSTTNAIYSYNNANFQYIVANLDTGNRDVLIYGGASSPVTLDWVFVRKSNVTGPVIINANGSDIPASIANFTMSNTTGSHPLKVNFTDTSINTPSSWNWSFGDGTYSDAQYPNKTFTTFGNYTIILNASNIAGWSNKTQYVLVSNFTDYIVTTYTSNGTFTVPSNVTFIEYLVVAGGGGGGARHGGGGGAGGLLQGTTFNVTSGFSYNITIGSGGAGDTVVDGTCHTGGAGKNSSFGNLSLNITSVGGGGGGGGDTCNGANGGSGGGATSRFAATGGSNVSGQGWAGGTTTGTFNGGGGGGGAGEAGHVRSGTLNGTGGNGTQSNITGTLVYYAGGGGAGTNNSFGGLGGGGAGGYGVPGTNGSANTGGGGGGMDEGTYTPGGNGGSGIVIIRYLGAGAAPVANFTMSNSTGASPLKVNFTDISSNTPTAWNWTFGGANFSDAQYPNYTFVGRGNYSVTLNVSNAYGFNNITKYVNVTTYTIVRFNTTGNNTWICPDNVTSIDYIIVAGGGGGGGDASGWGGAGGGGAGGMINGTTLSVKNGSVYNIIVGAGGTGAPVAGGLGANGNNSSFSNATFNLNATGGGGGGSTTSSTGATGGSGGGGGSNGGSCNGGSGISGQGSAGGACYKTNPFPTGGGGGAGSAGGSGSGRTSGSGGSGLGSNITVDNSIIVYAGGGAGSRGAGDNPRYVGTGGIGGGGDPVTSGTNGLGGGGGGGDSSTIAGSGGSGTVVIRYESITDITPVANFTASNWTGQAPLLVTFTDLSTNAPTSWNWTFNATSNTNFSDAYQPSFTYTVAGNYTVILNVSNSAGFDNVTKYIEVLPTPPVASFTLSNTTGYDSALVQFNDTSSNNPTAWIWNATNVTGNNTPFTFSLVQNASYIFGIGNFSISLNASNAGGSNVSTQNSWVNVSVGSVIVNFTSNVTNASIYAMVVRFNDTSTGSPTTWNWSFGDGRWFNTTDPNLVNTTYQYAVAGKYTVTLVANSTIGSNSTTRTEYINLTSDDDNNLISWLHMNGTDGSTTFDDEKGFAWLPTGNASMTTSTYKFGGSSGSFDGINSYISTPHNNEFNFSTGNDFTIEMWANVTSVNAGDQLIDKGNSSQTEGWGLDNSNGTEYGWDFWMGNDVTGQTPYFRIPMNEWTHVVITRESGTVKVYINGMLNATKAGMTGNYDTVNPLRIGFLPPTNYYNGYIDELRLSNNVSRWTSNFTTPYAEYKGDLEIVYPDINPDSTFRYKTNPGGIAYIDNQTQRNRTLQIQNVTHADYVVGSIIFNPLYDYVKSVQLNTSYYPAGMTLVSSSIDNNLGIINFNISRAAGFTPGTDRASILDYTVVYTNYTDGSDNVSEYFGSGYLVNSSVDRHYSISNFLPTQVTYGDWNFTANFTANNLTSPAFSPIQFNSTFTGSYPNRWNWSFGDGEVNNGINSTIIHSYNTGGYKNITLTEYLWQNGSVSNVTTKTNYIYIYHPTTANISSNVTSALVNIPIEFNASNSTNATWWNWSFGDGEFNNYTNETIIHSYTSSGIYYVNLTTSYNGYGEDTQSNYEIQILNSTITGFVANTTIGVYPLHVGFNVTNANDDATQWNWSFGDGTWQNGTTQNATHIYSTGGIYTVSELASNLFSMNVTTISDYITVYNQTVANISSNITSGLTYAPVQFNASNSTNATWWNWSFGDGTVDNITNESPLHIYTASGNYTVNLTTSNDGWGGNTQTNYYIQIYDSATTGFVANTTVGLYPVHVGFNVTSGDNATQWNWSFGDGTWQNGTTQNVTHIYSTGGIFTVIEIASNPHSTNTTTMVNYITVYNQTIANITSNVTSGLTPTAVQFYANTSTNATWWNWSFGDGNVSNITVENPVYTYTSGGNYTVTLTTSNDGWGEDIITPYYIQVYDAPITGFDANVTYGLLPLHVGFNVTNANDHATSWNWSFGDGTFGNTQNVTHIYTTGGNYTVYEIATNPYYSNVTSKSFYIRVFSPTSNTFTSNISSGYIPLNVLFTSVAVNATWLNWSWGDGTWSNVTNGTATALHIFTLPQNHTVNLTSSENGFGGCTTTHYINSTFYGAAASFTAVPSSGVPPLAVVFTDTSTNIPIAWNWSFGDGTYSDSQHANHTYSSVGVYTAILNASNTFGWSNYSRNITVYSGAPVANFTVNNSLGASPLAVRFSNDSTYTNASSVTWYWQFGDGGTSYDSDPVHTYTINGVYRANVTLTDEIGNDLSVDTLIYVTGSLIPIPDFIGVPTIGASPLNVTFTDLTLGGKTGWNWSFGDGNYSNLQNPTHNYTSNGQYTVTLVVANGTLSNYTTKVGYINVGVGTNVVNADYYGTPVTGNYPLTVQFYDTSVCNPICNSWNWDLDGDGATDSNAKNPVFTYNYPLTYSPKLIASNGVNSGTRVHVGYIIVGPTYMPTTIPQPTASWVPGYQDNQTGLSVSFRGDASTDLNNGTYLKYWLQNFTTTGNFNVYGFVTSVMAPLMHVFGFWIFLIIWGLYIFAVWIRSQDVTLPLIIGIISMGTFGLLFPKEALPVIIIMFVICGAIIITKLMKDSI